MTGGREVEAGAGGWGAIYRGLGVEPIINGRSTFTVLGGSLMPPEVLEAMRQAAESFVDLIELQEAVGRRVAQLTRNEAAFVSGGAAAGLFLTAAATMTRSTDDGILRIDDLDALPREFIIHRAHRVPYELAIRLAGGELIEIGTTERTRETELVGALGPSTAAVLYVPKPHLAAAVLPLDVVVRDARARGVPVIVDAAAQLPPVENLWRFSQAGADLVVFSGGKGLCGPASTGLVLGSARYVGRVARNAAPLQRLGRPMKVGKEDLIGLLAAVEWYLRQDHAALARRYDAMVEHVVAWGRDRADVDVTRSEFGEAGQPTPRARIRLPGWSGDARDRLLVSLRATAPRIDLLPDADDLIYVCPETLRPGEERIITARLEGLLETRAGS